MSRTRANLSVLHRLIAIGLSLAMGVDPVMAAFSMTEPPSVSRRSASAWRFDEEALSARSLSVATFTWDHLPFFLQLLRHYPNPAIRLMVPDDPSAKLDPEARERGTIAIRLSSHGKRFAHAIYLYELMDRLDARPFRRPWKAQTRERYKQLFDYFHRYEKESTPLSYTDEDIRTYHAAVIEMQDLLSQEVAPGLPRGSLLALEMATGILGDLRDLLEGKNQASFVDVPLAAVIQDAYKEAFSAWLLQRGVVTLHVDQKTASSIHVAGDRRKIHSIFLGLFQNAYDVWRDRQRERIKAGEEEKAAEPLDFNIVIHALAEDRSVLIEIADNAGGVQDPTLLVRPDPSVDRQAAFYLNVTRRAGGTGLGLAEAWHWVRLHDRDGNPATIRLENDHGPDGSLRGARFILRLPEASLQTPAPVTVELFRQEFTFKSSNPLASQTFAFEAIGHIEQVLRTYSSLEKAPLRQKIEELSALVQLYVGKANDAFIAGQRKDRHLSYSFTQFPSGGIRFAIASGEGPIYGTFIPGRKGAPQENKGSGPTPGQGQQRSWTNGFPRRPTGLAVEALLNPLQAVRHFRGSAEDRLTQTASRARHMTNQGPLDPENPAQDKGSSTGNEALSVLDEDQFHVDPSPETWDPTFNWIVRNAEDMALPHSRFASMSDTYVFKAAIANAMDAVIMRNPASPSEFSGMIHLRVEETPDFLQLVISDNGVGIEKETLQKLFLAKGSHISTKRTKEWEQRLFGISGADVERWYSQFVRKDRGDIIFVTRTRQGSWRLSATADTLTAPRLEPADRALQGTDVYFRLWKNPGASRARHVSREGGPSDKAPQVLDVPNSRWSLLRRVLGGILEATPPAPVAKTRAEIVKELPDATERFLRNHVINDQSQRVMQVLSEWSGPDGTIIEPEQRSRIASQLVDIVRAKGSVTAKQKAFIEALGWQSKPRSGKAAGDLIRKLEHELLSPLAYKGPVDVIGFYTAHGYADRFQELTPALNRIVQVAAEQSRPVVLLMENAGTTHSAIQAIRHKGDSEIKKVMHDPDYTQRVYFEPLRRSARSHAHRQVVFDRRLVPSDSGAFFAQAIQDWLDAHSDVILVPEASPFEAWYNYLKHDLLLIPAAHADAEVTESLLKEAVHCAASAMKTRDEQIAGRQLGEIGNAYRDPVIVILFGASHSLIHQTINNQKFRQLTARLEELSPFKLDPLEWLSYRRRSEPNRPLSSTESELLSHHKSIAYQQDPLYKDRSIRSMDELNARLDSLYRMNFGDAFSQRLIEESPSLLPNLEILEPSSPAVPSGLLLHGSEGEVPGQGQQRSWTNGFPRRASGLVVDALLNPLQAVRHFRGSAEDPLTQTASRARHMSHEGGPSDKAPQVLDVPNSRWSLLRRVLGRILEATPPVPVAALDFLELKGPVFRNPVTPYLYIQYSPKDVPAENRVSDSKRHSLIDQAVLNLVRVLAPGAGPSVRVEALAKEQMGLFSTITPVRIQEQSVIVEIPVVQDRADPPYKSRIESIRRSAEQIHQLWQRKRGRFVPAFIALFWADALPVAVYEFLNDYEQVHVQDGAVLWGGIQQEEHPLPEPEAASLLAEIVAAVVYHYEPSKNGGTTLSDIMINAGDFMAKRLENNSFRVKLVSIRDVQTNVSTNAFIQALIHLSAIETVRSLAELEVAKRVGIRFSQRAIPFSNPSIAFEGLVRGLTYLFRDQGEKRAAVKARATTQAWLRAFRSSPEGQPFHVEVDQFLAGQLPLKLGTLLPIDFPAPGSPEQPSAHRLQIAA